MGLRIMWSSLAVFTIFATLAFAEWDPPEFPDGSDLEHFITRPELKAPRLNVTEYYPDAIKDGYWFFAPYTDLESQPKSARREHVPFQVGPHIYDRNGVCANLIANPVTSIANLLTGSRLEWSTRLSKSELLRFPSRGHRRR